MDAFSNLLRGVRADGMMLSRLTPSPPWALRVTTTSPITLCTPLRGDGWLVLPGGVAPTRLRPGDTAIVGGPVTFSFVDDPDEDTERPCAEICRADPVEVARMNPVDAPEGSSSLMVVEFPVRGAIGRRLLDVLPTVLMVPADPSCADILDYIVAEIVADRPGQQVVLERLLEWVLVCTLRAWFDTPGNAAPPWYLAMSDPLIGAALRAIHDDHARPWTVASLAQTTGVSRATLAKRFTDLVGEPPLSYLTGWRMAVAADLLAEPGATVAGVAGRVGYADAFGFSAAFKRTRGVSPSDFRRTLIQPAGSVRPQVVTP